MQIEEYIKLYKNGGYIKEMRKHVGHAPILTCACGVIIEKLTFLLCLTLYRYSITLMKTPNVIWSKKAGNSIS